MWEWLGTGFLSEDFTFAREVLQRGTGAVYVVAFIAALRQFPALLGERGLLPAPRFLGLVSVRQAPSLFHWRYSDRLLRTVAWLGLILSAAVIAGLPQAGPWWVPMLVFLALYGLYLSIVNVGQVFYGFGWESLLLETGFLAAFLGSHQTGVPLVTLFAFRWLLFRVEFGAGLIKLRGDTVWRDLTALDYHHETQPMPGPLSWFFHHLPRPLHRIEVLANHVVQLLVPVLLFFPQPIATWAAGAVVITQLWLVLSGNFAWLNWVTILLAFAAVSDGVLGFAPTQFGPTEGASAPVLGLVAAGLGVFILALSGRPALNLLSRRQRMNFSNPWHLVGSYGAFGSITRRRQEVIIEGTLDVDPQDATWAEYEFPGKPGSPGRWPRQIAPYHLRLDWGMWFLALGSSAQFRWFERLLLRLLEADPATLALLSRDPFHGEAPRWIRARLFDYRYTTPRELRERREWWHREEAATLIGPVRR